MPDVAFEGHEHHVTVRYTGDLVYGDLVSLAGEILDHCRSSGRCRVVLDVTGSAGDLGIIGRYRIGRYLSRTWDRSVRLAVLVRQEHVLPDRFWETVTRNRGLDTGGFTDEAAAVEWLASR